MKDEYCEACGCNPCDCGWGSYVSLASTCERCGMEYKYCECHWGDKIKGDHNAKNLAHKRYSRTPLSTKSST